MNKQKNWLFLGVTGVLLGTFFLNVITFVTDLLVLSIIAEIVNAILGAIAFASVFCYPLIARKLLKRKLAARLPTQK